MADDPYIGQEIIGQFRIVQRIGKGGMGAVYKAEQPAMGRFVAVKILHRQLASRPDLVTRFRREARAMSRLTHPNTVRVFLYGQLDNQALYIVMEYLKGLNLHQITKRQGAMPLDRAARVLIQVCGALEEAHSVGIVHRDLKPENILLTEQGGMKDFAKVLDFGLAKVHDIDLQSSSPLTQEGMVFGTPEFMSPEQARGKTLDGRSDIYSLGVILYEMITGKLPFDARNPTDYIRHHIKSPPIPVTQRVPELTFPPQLDDVINKALAKTMDERFQSAADLAAALEPFAGDVSHAAHRPQSESRPPEVQDNGRARASGGLRPRTSGTTPVSKRGEQKRSSLWIAIILLAILVVVLGGMLITVLVTDRGGG
jgi:serine/threonine-protein kinase